MCREAVACFRSYKTPGEVFGLWHVLVQHSSIIQPTDISRKKCEANSSYFILIGPLPIHKDSYMEASRGQGVFFTRNGRMIMPFDRIHTRTCHLGNVLSVSLP